jgi:hypothetical protein
VGSGVLAKHISESSSITHDAANVRTCGLKEPPMIDDPRKTDLLISMLKESLPIEANITQYLAGAMLERSPDITIPKKCAVTSGFYTGNVGGALCGLDMGGAETDNAHVVSITHLAFDRRVPLSRELAWISQTRAGQGGEHGCQRAF